MNGVTASALISTEALAAAVKQKAPRLLDASWHMPSEKRDARAEYAAGHLPGAVFFDIDAISDHGSPYPHMLPSPEEFADEVVVYDASGIFSSARVWWMFRVFGHDKVRVLDGGLPKWKAEDRPLETGMSTPSPSLFKSAFRPELLRDRRDVADNIANPRERLIDARSPGRFSGTEPEPRQGLASGHIEGSANIFFRDVLMPPYNTLKSREALQALFEAKAINPAGRAVATCGSGVTACILALALHELGNPGVAVYDGAWAEWGSIPTKKAVC